MATDTESEAIHPDYDPDSFHVWATDVHINRAEDEFNPLRAISAAVVDGDYDRGDVTRIGTVSGWVVRDLEPGMALYDAADAVDDQAMVLGRAAEEILDAATECPSSALLIDRIDLRPQWRGHKLAGTIIRDLLNLLWLDARRTIVVGVPEPMTSTGRIEDDSERDAAKARLEASHRASSGARQWRNTRVWWLPYVEIDDSVARPRHRSVIGVSNSPKSLSMTDGGVWLVTTTAGGHYVLDLDEHTLLELPDSLTQGHEEGLTPEDFAVMRIERDAWAVLLIGLVDGTVRVGHSARFLVGGTSGWYPGYSTKIEETTSVVGIQRLPGEDGL